LVPISEKKLLNSFVIFVGCFLGISFTVQLSILDVLPGDVRGFYQKIPGFPELLEFAGS
jgi:hypothetical protein